MAGEYYIAVNGQQQGPYGPDALLQVGMRPDSLVWREGMPDWEPAGTLADLAPLFRGPQMVPPPMNYNSGYAPPQQQGYGYAPPQQQGYGPPPYRPTNSGDRVAAGVCGIFLGWAGVHKFILGLNGAGITMLLISVLSCGTAAPIVAIIGFIEGVIYLSKDDADFYHTYVVGRKSWF